MDALKITNIVLLYLVIFASQSLANIEILTDLEGKKLYAYQLFTFQYSNTNHLDVLIEFTSDSGFTWSPIDTFNTSESDGIYTIDWIVPYLSSSKCKLKISDISDSDNFAISKSTFRIIPIHNDFIAVNEIKMFYSNNGIGSHDLINGYRAGFRWPGGLEAIKSAAYSDGLIWAGKIDGEIRANGSLHRTGLKPGNILDDNTPADPLDEKFHIWKIEQTPSNSYIDKHRTIEDYNNWPADLGAPWIDINEDGFYTKSIDKPKIYGDETNWFVMNDLDTLTSRYTYGTDPIGLEIQCTIFGYKENEILKDVVFKRYLVINKGKNLVENMYLGYWSDPDLGGGGAMTMSAVIRPLI